MRSSINDIPADGRRELPSVEGAQQHPPIDRFMSSGVIKVRLRCGMVIRQQRGGAGSAADTGSDHVEPTVRAITARAKDFNEIIRSLQRAVLRRVCEMRERRRGLRPPFLHHRAQR